MIRNSCFAQWGSSCDMYAGWYHSERCSSPTGVFERQAWTRPVWRTTCVCHGEIERHCKFPIPSSSIYMGCGVYTAPLPSINCLLSAIRIRSRFTYLFTYWEIIGLEIAAWFARRKRSIEHFLTNTSSKKWKRRCILTMQEMSDSYFVVPDLMRRADTNKFHSVPSRQEIPLKQRLKVDL